MAEGILLPSDRTSNPVRETQTINRLPLHERTFRAAAQSYLARGKSNRYVEPIVAYFGDTLVADIAPIDVYDMAEALYAGRKGATKNRQGLAPARAILLHAYEKGWRDRICLRRFKEDPPAQKVPATQAWLHAFSRQCRVQRLDHLSALVLFMYTTGARVSEAIRLEWTEVDFGRRQAVLLKTKTSVNSVRDLSNEMVERLVQLKAKQHRSKRVFRYACRQSVNQRIKAVCKRAGIRVLSSHACGRVSFANHLMESGMDIKTVMNAGDWRSIVVFMGTYVKGRANAGKLAAERFGQYDFSAEL